MNKTPVTSFTYHKTAEGSRLSATYSEKSEDGKLIRSNERFNVIVADEEIQGCIDKINTFLESKIPT